MAAVLLMCVAACGTGADGSVVGEVDSLNARSYGLRFTSARESMRYADEVIRRYGGSGYSDGVHVAWLNKAYAHYMLMRYDSVRVCCDVVMSESRNDMLRTLADVNMMLTCNMLGMSKEFYDYRNDAKERLRRLDEEWDSMDEGHRRMCSNTLAQFHMASLHYFVRMRLADDVNESAEWLDSNTDLFADDTTLVANHLMLKSMLKLADDGSGTDLLTWQRRLLINLLQISIEHGYDYITAEALHRLSRSIISNGGLRPAMSAYLMDYLVASQPDSALSVFGSMGGDFDLALGEVLDRQALRLFELFGNSYTISRALITLSDYRLRCGMMEEALQYLERALSLVNEHHRLLHADCQQPELLPFSDELDTLSTEMLWIADPQVMAVPVWMQNIREQLSVVYGAMGRKAESDYNHNVYFDILDATRQDQRVVQERENLNRQEVSLNWLIVAFVVALVLMAWMLFVFNRRSMARFEQRVKCLDEAVARCGQMMAALDGDIEDEDELEERLESIEGGYAAQCGAGDSFVREMTGRMQMCRQWVKKKGLELIGYADEQRRIENETSALERKYTESKKQYLEKLVSMSIVEGITPFLDRALREVKKMKEAEDADPTTTAKRLQYINELIDKIIYHNDVLGHWVKIRQGEVMLNIENFALQPLLDTMRLSQKAFAAKGIQLCVADSDAVVKADKALTLFMMNTLLDNARKYTPEGGTVSLTAAVLDDCVEVVVEDSGHGMSDEDVATINGQKVYDSSKIGITGDAADKVKAQKGFGFGLMNCRGIIEKYRKTNSLFAVCRFGVTSHQGMGSRFFFRLPKGVVKVLSLIILIMSGVTARADNDLLDMAEYYADCQLSANVAGDYEMAIEYADSALTMLNAHYLEQMPESDCLMNLDGGAMAELDWWRDGFDTDFDRIIGIRNEVAISALALNLNSLYHYNAECFKQLYTLANTDHTFEQYCNDTRQANRNRRAIAVALGLTIAIVLIIFFFIHFRRTPDEALVAERMATISDVQEQMAARIKSEHGEKLELLDDERRRVDREQQRVHVQNMIIDNCMSALKHETMYYPNRIKQLIDADAPPVDDISELLVYYKQLFSLLSACAGKQVEKMLFKRATATAGDIGAMARKAHKRAAAKDRSLGRFVEMNGGRELRVMVDHTFVQMLVANVVSLYQEHHSGGDLVVGYEEMDDFVRFTFTDTAHSIAGAEVSGLFYVDNVKYDAKADMLVGMQYLIAKQIIREHDKYSLHRGCRIYVEEAPNGGSSFVFTLQKA